MQSFQLIQGLYDTEIQEKILAEAANRELALADIVKLAEAIESGKRSSGVLSRYWGLNRLSGSINSQANKSTKFCLYCGGAWHEGPNWKKSLYRHISNLFILQKERSSSWDCCL